jgi:hypothetical protein
METGTLMQERRFERSGRLHRLKDLDYADTGQYWLG